MVSCELIFENKYYIKPPDEFLYFKNNYHIVNILSWIVKKYQIPQLNKTKKQNKKQKQKQNKTKNKTKQKTKQKKKTNKQTNKQRKCWLKISTL